MIPQRFNSRNSTIYFVTGALLVLVVVIGIGVRMHMPVGTKANDWSGSNTFTADDAKTSNDGNRNSRSLPILPGGEDAVKKEAPIHQNDYRGFLDSVCRRLTPAEEDRILAESARDSNFLIGLALGGSDRAAQWLHEALLKDSGNPLVHYAILSRNDPGFDRLRSAAEFMKLAPQDAEPLYASAAELVWQKADRGDRDSAIARLKEAAQRETFSSLHQSALESVIDAYVAAGRSKQEAQARTYLEDISTVGDVAIGKLSLEFDVLQQGKKITPGMEEVAALLLDATEKAIYSSGLSLNSYRQIRSMEIEYLQGFLRASVEAADPSIAGQYLTAPTSEMLAAAQKELKEWENVKYFSLDTPGIYQRLNNGQKSELIERLQRDGQVSAFFWAYKVRPEIFRSPDFMPRGFTKSQWKFALGQ